MNDTPPPYYPESDSVVPTPPPAPAPKPRMLAIWTLVVNLIYYGLIAVGVLIIGLLFIQYQMSNQIPGMDGLAFSIALLFGLIIYSILHSTVGIVMLVLNIVYLIKAKPIGRAKVLTLISTGLYMLSWAVFTVLAVVFRDNIN